MRKEKDEKEMTLEELKAYTRQYIGPVSEEQKAIDRETLGEAFIQRLFQTDEDETIH